MAAHERVGQLRRVGDPVGVAAPARGEAGVEALGGLAHAAYAHVGRQDPVDAASQGVERRVGGPPGGGLDDLPVDVDVRHLAARVHAGVRTPGDA